MRITSDFREVVNRWIRATEANDKKVNKEKLLVIAAKQGISVTFSSTYLTLEKGGEVCKVSEPIKPVRFIRS
jgi:hypothetical protein